jgi:50S ribosomal subunit-associated GTPase HflX
MTRLATRNHLKDNKQLESYRELITFYNKLDKPQKEEFRHHLEQMKNKNILVSQIEENLLDLSQDNYAELTVRAKLLLLS